MTAHSGTAISLDDLADRHLDAATVASSGRSAETVYGGSDHVLRQTMIALTAGSALSEHENPGEATLQVLRGRIRLTAGADAAEGGPGELLVIPASRHALEALEASVVLLTVGKQPLGPKVTLEGCR